MTTDTNYLDMTDETAINGAIRTLTMLISVFAWVHRGEFELARECQASIEEF